MGIFSSGNKNNTSVPPNTRSGRAKCWEARDIYFKCLDRINVIDPLNVSNANTIKENCGKEDLAFNESCASSWISYFKEKRLMEYKKEQFAKQIEIENAARQPKQ